MTKVLLQGRGAIRFNGVVEIRAACHKIGTAELTWKGIVMGSYDDDGEQMKLLNLYGDVNLNKGPMDSVVTLDLTEKGNVWRCVGSGLVLVNGGQLERPFTVCGDLYVSKQDYNESCFSFEMSMEFQEIVAVINSNKSEEVWTRGALHKRFIVEALKRTIPDLHARAIIEEFAIAIKENQAPNQGLDRLQHNVNQMPSDLFLNKLLTTKCEELKRRQHKLRSCFPTPEFLDFQRDQNNALTFRWRLTWALGIRENVELDVKVAFSLAETQSMAKRRILIGVVEKENFRLDTPYRLTISPSIRRRLSPGDYRLFAKLTRASSTSGEELVTMHDLRIQRDIVCRPEMPIVYYTVAGNQCAFMCLVSPFSEEAKVNLAVENGKKETIFAAKVTVTKNRTPFVIQNLPMHGSIRVKTLPDVNPTHSDSFGPLTTELWVSSAKAVQINPATCSLCRKPIPDPNQWEIAIPNCCCHIFHAECLTSWTSTNSKQRCPTCLFRFTTIVLPNIASSTGLTSLAPCTTTS